MKRSLLVLFLVLWLLGKARPGLAHGGGVARVVGGRLGPYRVNIWTFPEPPRVGTFHITVAVYEPGVRMDTPIRHARVQARLTHESGVTLQASAPPSETYPHHHEIDVALDRPGRWDVEISVTTPEAQGNFAFAVQVDASSGSSRVFLVGAGLLAMVALWWWLTRRQGGR